MYKLAVGTGFLMLLLAAVLFAQGERAASPGVSDQRLRVQQVLAGAAPCAACHTAVSDIPRLELETGRAGSTSAASSPHTSAVHNEPIIKKQIAHTTELRRSIGARLLAIPDRNSAEYTAVVDRYVAASETLDRADTLSANVEALHVLDAVERHVLALEQQANPVRLGVASALFAPEAGSVASAPPVPQPLVALAGAVIGAAPPGVVAFRRERVTWIRPPRFVRGGRRRGPPREACRCLSSVGKGRLRLVMARSLFSFVRRFYLCRTV